MDDPRYQLFIINIHISRPSLAGLEGVAAASYFVVFIVAIHLSEQEGRGHAWRPFWNGQDCQVRL